MTQRFSGMFALLLAGALTFSCDKKEFEEIAPADTFSDSTNVTASSIQSSNLIFEETFEGSTVFSGVRQQFGSSHTFKVVDSPVFQGAKSGRFELRASDPETSGGTRAEVLFPELTNKNRWYSFSAYYPSSGYKDDSYPEIISQWHQQGGTSPTTTLQVRYGKFLLRVGNGNSSSEKTYDLGIQTKDTWHEFVVHINHSYGSDGLVEVWHNGTKKVTHYGGNMFDNVLPRWKVGLYKWLWNSDKTTDTNLRIFYLDNIRMGNEKASFTDMSSASASVPSQPTQPEPTPTEPTPTEPTPTEPARSSSILKVVSFTLVDASTEKDVRTIRNGETISLRSLNSSKLNIRANTDPSTVGSVKFALSGKQNHTYTDSATPFALMGDNGSGNYYYGTWNPPAVGTYTLTATPYADIKGTGTAGPSTSITFYIKK